MYDGITNTLAATSNVATTTLTDACSVLITKSPLSETFRNGEVVSYVVRVENTGSAALANVTAPAATAQVPGVTTVVITGTVA